MGGSLSLLRLAPSLGAGATSTFHPTPLPFGIGTTSPTGNEERLAVGPYSGHLSNFGEILTLANSTAATVSTFNTPVDPSDPQLYLVISEIMYHPADPNPEAEFIELMNISDFVAGEFEWSSFHRWNRLQLSSGDHARAR